MKHAIVRTRNAGAVTAAPATQVRQVAPRFRDRGGNVLIPDTKNLKKWYRALGNIIHTQDPNLAQVLISQAAVSLDATRPLVDKVNAALVAINGISPRDQLEALLVVQMVATHNLALDFLKRATNPGAHPEMVSENIDRAAKLMRAYAAQLTALERHRGYGKQYVTVEHVHVNSGGQAIVGAVQGAKREG